MSFKKLLTSLGFGFSDDELKKNELKKLLKRLAKRHEKLKHALSIKNIDKETKETISEELKIVAQLKDKSTKELKSLIKKIKKGKK